ncbi:MAG: 30S ribosomal protein S30e [Candidatus Hermodarchaeota archaeon]
MVRRKRQDLTRAGKVRRETPRVQANIHRSPIPRIHNRKKYNRRIKDTAN